MLHACCLSRAPGSGFRAVCRPPLADGMKECAIIEGTAVTFSAYLPSSVGS
jgi:hypothetical protein